MSVRFIIGRAGTGKTHHCLDAIRSELRASPIEGPRLVFLVPEQAGLQMERAILSLDVPAGIHNSEENLPAAHRAEVLSFQRLAFRVLDSVGGSGHRALTEPARAMVLRHLVSNRSSELRYYERAAREGVSAGRLGGFVERLCQTISELILEGVDPEQLVEADDTATATGDGSLGGDPAQRAKLHDLHLIYRAYLDYLGGERLDPSQYLEAARELAPRCSWLDGARLWVDGFASLSGQETTMLVELATRCQSVDITIMMDPSLRDGRCPATGSASDVRRLFSRTHRTYTDLHDRFIHAGLDIEDPLVFEGSPARFQPGASLATIERSLFCGSDTSETQADTSPRGVELAELPSRRIEVDYAVSRVVQWVQDPARNYRYRDIAIIVRDLEPYHDLLSEALDARQIPFFIDRRRPIAHHPLVALLRTAPTLAAESMSIESVRTAIKTGMLPVSAEAADELENYLLAHALTGIDAWRGHDWVFRPRPVFGAEDKEPTVYETALLRRVNVTRRALFDCLDPFLTFSLDSQPHDGPAWTSAIQSWLGRLGAGAALQQWAGEAEADGDLDQAEEHRQVWREVMSFLDDLAFAFKDAFLTTGELADVLDTGLGGLTLGLVPPTVDQVLVGSIERSRHPNIKAAIVLGFNEGVFPKRLSEDSILNDDDRALLQDAGIRVRPPARKRALDEALLVYSALTRPGLALLVTYAGADNDGKPLRPSPYVDALCAACPGLSPKSVADPRRAREMWDILSIRDLGDRLTSEFRARPALADDDPSLRGRWNELYDSIRADLGATVPTHQAMATLDERSSTNVSPQSIQRWCGGSLRTSVSELETFAACPFQRFARHVLRLSERAEAAIDPVDVGQVHHAVLEDFVRTVADRGVGFSQLGDGELIDHLRESCRRVATRLPAGGIISDARNTYKLGRSAAELARVIQAQRRLSKSGVSRPRRAEQPFGFDEPGGLPALALSTPAGRRVLVRGYIDRVDLAELGDELLGIVIDYKRKRDRPLSLCEVYHGLSLQLLGYMLVLREVGHTLAGRPIKPIGALYVGLAQQYQSIDHPNALSARDKTLQGTARPRGLLLADDFAALDGSGETGRWSDGYSVYIKKDGAVRIDQGDAADADAFDSLLDHTRTKLGELADGILDGRVAASPYRLGTLSPCTWCAMPAVCRFEMGILEARFLDELRRSEVFRILAGRSSEPNSFPPE